MRRLALLMTLLVVACSSGGGPARERTRPTSPPSTADTTTTPTTPVFDAAVAGVGDATRGRMRRSWRPGCPMPLEKLRLLTLDHWGYDGIEKQGELIVHADQADAIVNAFRVLFDGRFPIERMQLVDACGYDTVSS